MWRLSYRAKRRCLVHAGSFCEWEARPDGKQPSYFFIPEGELLAFSGSWEQWRQPDGEILKTYSVITTEPNDFMRRFHDCMPVVLEERNYEEWLVAHDPRGFLKACHNEALMNHPVSKRVNSVKNTPVANRGYRAIAWG